jgi:RNA polymerase sigma-70 factor (ECF subfamily)
MAELAPDSTETRDLLRQADAGDRQAFDRLFARHRPTLRRFVELRLDPRVRTRVDPSDVVQDTQLEALRRLDDYLARRPMPFHVWLRKTAHERLLMVRRRHLGAERRSVRREARLPERSSLLLAQRLVSAAPSPSQQVQHRDLIPRVRQALAALADTDAEILLMREYEELSYQEIATILDIEATAARKRYGRALLRLHKVLTDTGLTGSEP